VLSLGAAVRISRRERAAECIAGPTERRVHITDTPAASAKGVQKQRAGTPAAGNAPAEGGQQNSYDLQLAMKDYPVALYTSPMCKEPCQRARDHLNKRGVPFAEIQVWTWTARRADARLGHKPRCRP